MSGFALPSLTRPSTSASAGALWKTRRPGALGELMLISTASARGSTRRWHRTISSVVAPDTLAVTGALTSSRARSRCRAMASRPLLGNPSALMSDCSFTSRNIRGFGLPDFGKLGDGPSREVAEA